MAGGLTLGGSKDNTINTRGGSLAINGPVTGGAADRLVKTGAGTLTLNAADSTYQGPTVILDGVVAVNGSSIPDANTVIIDGGKLAITGTEKVAKLYYGDQPQPEGTYGATDSGAQNINNAYFSGTGVLVVGAGGGDGYDDWAAANITNGMTGRSQDADGDGLSNLQEFLFGTDPMAATGSLSSAEKSGGNLILRWLQRESGVSYRLKESATLTAGSWADSTLVPGLDPDQAGVPADYDRHRVVIPLGQAPVKFFRIEGTED